MSQQTMGVAKIVLTVGGLNRENLALFVPIKYALIIFTKSLQLHIFLCAQKIELTPYCKEELNSNSQGLLSNQQLLINKTL